MDVKSERQKKIYFDDGVIVTKDELIRCLSWLDFIPETYVDNEDIRTRDSILRLITFITRNDKFD